MLYKELADRKLPDYLRFSDGSKVSNVEEWELRKREIKELLSHHFLGYPPHFKTKMKGVTQKVENDALGGKATSSVV
ncbi:MAG TPA: hypothetical protein GX707_03315, partial [Epulopiscium sp.]|nr:hypothetical protein [Candidatus Epulonipiscium sp.]